MFSNSLKMITVDQNMSELWQIVYKSIIFMLIHMLLLLCQLFINAWTLNNFKIIIRCLFFTFWKKNLMSLDVAGSNGHEAGAA